MTYRIVQRHGAGIFRVQRRVGAGWAFEAMNGSAREFASVAVARRYVEGTRRAAAREAARVQAKTDPWVVVETV